jgi:hypothetical protein
MRGFQYFLFFVEKKRISKYAFWNTGGGKIPAVPYYIYIYIYIYIGKERRKHPKGITIHTRFLSVFFI